MSSLRPVPILLVVASVGFLSGLVGGSVAVQVLEETQNAPPAAVIPSSGRGDTLSPAARSIEDRTVQVVKSASQSVVSIQIRKTIQKKAVRRFSISPFDDFFEFPSDEFFFQGEQQDGQSERIVGGGTGFIVSSDGIILTNKHVVSDPDARYVVITADKKEHEATVLDTDPVNDLAVVKIKSSSAPFRPLEFGNSRSIEIGQTVIAIGNTLSQYQNTVTTGVVSGIGRRVVAGSGAVEGEVIEQAIQTDAASNPGNSGGPLLDLNGKVIGVNTAINRQGQSIGFAIPSEVAARVVESVKQNGRIIRPWLGVRYVLIDAEVARQKSLTVTHGALLLDGDGAQQPAVVPSSPAAAAGLKEGDVIIAVNGEDVTAEQPLGSLIARYQPGKTVTVTVLQNGKERMIQVILAEFGK